MLNDITKIDTNFISGNSTPWIPFAPVNDKIMLKYLKIDPARGEVTMLMKVPAGEGAHKHRHTGIVTVYTIAGSWQYVGHNWVSKAGDYVFETAGSTHSFTTLGEKETVAYVMVQGELQFVDGQPHPRDQSYDLRNLVGARKLDMSGGMHEEIANAVVDGLRDRGRVLDRDGQRAEHADVPVL